MENSARESEIFPDGSQSSSSSEQGTGILMVSLPDSSDAYQTPPEQHDYSQNSSNDDQVPATKTTAICREMNSGKAGGGDPMTGDDDDEEPLGQRMVDLANDSDNLGLEGTIDEVNTENLACETEDTEIIGSLDEDAHQVFVEMPKRDGTVNLSTGKRKLPSSLHKEEQNRTENSRGDFMNTLDRVWKMLKHGNEENEENEDIDFIETAKSRGLIFPSTRSPEDSTRIKKW